MATLEAYSSPTCRDPRYTMTSTSDHEVRQPSRQNTVESPSASSPDSNSTRAVKRKGSLVIHPNPSPTPLPTSPRSIHFQETSNTVESHSCTTGDPGSTITVKRKASIVILSNPPIPTSPRRTDRHFQETERRTTKVTETTKKITRCPLDTHPGAGTEVVNWRGPDRTKLVKEGYTALALMCTFVAAVQGQLLQMTYTQTDKTNQIINALFFAGLFADIGAAILSALSARWFEMLTPDEAAHVYDWLFEPWRDQEGLEAQVPPTDERRSHFVIEWWLYLGLKSGLYASFIGLGFLVTGLMLYVWAHTPMIVQVMSTVSFACLVLLLPPFFLPHDRIQALRLVRLHRFSGRQIAGLVAFT